MVNYSDARMDAVFTALADATRRGMIARLSTGPATIGELGQPFGISKPAVTKHVKMLERAGLIRRRRDGRIHNCTLQTRPMQQAVAWMERQREFWEDSLDALAGLVEKTKPGGTSA